MFVNIISTKMYSFSLYLVVLCNHALISKIDSFSFNFRKQNIQGGFHWMDPSVTATVSMSSDLNEDYDGQTETIRRKLFLLFLF